MNILKQTTNQAKLIKFYDGIVKKRIANKKLNQSERIFLELFRANPKPLPSYHFSMTMSPAILQYGRAIHALRTKHGIPIKNRVVWIDGHKEGEFRLEI